MDGSELVQQWARVVELDVHDDVADVGLGLEVLGRHVDPAPRENTVDLLHHSSVILVIRNGDLGEVYRRHGGAVVVVPD
jgi:hypothetical protein